MEHIRIEVVGNTARAAERPGRITSGTVGLPVYFSFDSQWDGLKKTAVFRAGRVCRTVDSLGTETAVPWEVLERPNVWLSIGVYGVNEDGSVAIPTIWTNVRVIQAGASPEGDPGTEPTLPVWQKLLNTVGNLFGLKTKAKTSIVDAVNEVRALAMGGGVVPDVTLSESGVPADAKATGDAIGGILGKDNTVLSESSVAFGEGNTVGLLGYYWSNIDFSTKTITLSTVQGEEVWSNDTVVTWTAGDVVSIVNNTKYECCAKIVSIDGNAITLDSLPFYRVDDPDDFSFDDRGIFVPDKPTEGIVDLGKQSAAIGLGNKASNWCAVAVGRENVAQGQYSFVAGRGNVGKAYAGYIEGLYNTQENTALYSHVEGLQNTVRGKVSHAEGAGNETNGDYAHAEGYHTKAGESAAHAEGNATQATGPAAHAEGNGTKATVKHAHAEGDRTEATEWAAHAEGIGSKATGWAAHAEGNATQAGAKAHAEGVSSIASAEAAHAEGSSTKASALGAHSEGRETVASDEGAHAEGFKSKASMLYTHAEGRQTEASGENAHAEGRETVASAREAHAEGFQTKARAAYAHAEGCMTTADGGGSHAQGGATKALGEYSSAEGGWTIAREQCQSVAGKYNADDPNALYIVGVGTSDSARKNGFGVRKDGTSTLYGNRLTEVGGPSTSTDAANKGYVDTKVAKAFGGNSINVTADGCLYRDNGVIEWINPPMEEAVECRTIERWGGAPVYVKRINMGAAPINNTISMAHGIADIDRLVSFESVATSGMLYQQLPVIAIDGTPTLKVYASPTELKAVSFSETTADYSIEVVLKYTKK